jgi:anti-anti-sigma factor
MAKQFSTHQDDRGAHTALLESDLLESGIVAQFGREIDELVAQPTIRDLTIDFTNVRHLSSASIGVLMHVQSRMQSRGGRVRLSHLDKNLTEIFRIMKLRTVFGIE